MHPKAITWAVAGAATGCALGVTFAAGLSLDTKNFLIFVGCVGALAGLQTFYARRGEALIADLFGTVGASGCAITMVGTLAVAGLALGAPLADATLIRLDAAVGLDARAVVEAVSLVPVTHWPLRLAYLLSSVLIVLTPVALVLLRRPEAAWRFCAMVCLSALACGLLSTAFPAAGAFVGLSVPPEVVARLPEGAGLYHMSVFETYRENLAQSVDVFGEGGVVTFPSFHTAFACATAHAWMPWPRLRLPVLAWTALVLASTIVIGGHYFVDLLAGAGIFAAALVATERRRASSAALPQPATLA